MFCDDFIRKLEEQYPSHSWNDIRSKIYVMIKELFEAVTLFQEPRGIPHNPQCKGSYGLDIMLDWATDDSGKSILHLELLASPPPPIKP